MGKRFKIILSTGLAMFSMFFGAGNISFPLDVGRVAGDMNFYAIIGLVFTAVLVPFAGLLAMFLFEGDYESFFYRIGRWPGFLVITLLMALIGPFAAIPRCITLSFSTLNMYFPGIKIFQFSFLATVLLFILTVNRRQILDLLGRFLSPLLIISLMVLAIKGLISHPPATATNYTPIQMFTYGFKEGYYTLDLLAAFFFSVVVLIGLKRSLEDEIELDSDKGRRAFFKITLISSIIGVSLLATIYTAFSYVTSFHGQSLLSVQKDTILSVLATMLLGDLGGGIANIAVILACLTTAITLGAVFAEFIQNELFKRKLNYKSSLAVTLILSFAVSNLGFMGILKAIEPILMICYPALIVLTFLNIANKLFGLKFVKIPVLLTFIVSIVFYFI